MRKKKFITHFIVLTLFIFVIGYFSAHFIEVKTQQNDQQMILNKAVKASEDTIRILNNKLMDIENKRAALNLLFEGLLQRESSFVSYQICALNQNNIFQPILSAKRSEASFVNLKLSDVYNLQGQIRSNFIQKDRYMIYHQEVNIRNKLYGRLFIAFYKTSTIEASYKIYKHVFAFILGIVILGILVFVWYYRKVDQLKPSLISQSKKYKQNNRNHAVDNINLDELFIPKKENPFDEKANIADKPNNIQRNNHG